MCTHICIYITIIREQPAKNRKESNEVHGWGSWRKGKSGNDVIILPKKYNIVINKNG